MASVIAVRPVTAENRPVVECLWQLYRPDLSEFRGQHGPSGFRGTLPGEDGTFALRSLLPFLAEDPDRATYLFYDGTSPVGFDASTDSPEPLTGGLAAVAFPDVAHVRSWESGRGRPSRRCVSRSADHGADGDQPTGR